MGFNYWGWGTKLLSFDNDGGLDLFVANVPTEERLKRRFPADRYAEPRYLLRNDSGRRFLDVSDRTGRRAFSDRVGRGTAFADFDNDGDSDILAVNKNDVPARLRSDGGTAATGWQSARAARGAAGTSSGRG